MSNATTAAEFTPAEAPEVKAPENLVEVIGQALTDEGVMVHPSALARIAAAVARALVVVLVVLAVAGCGRKPTAEEKVEAVPTTRAETPRDHRAERLAREKAEAEKVAAREKAKEKVAPKLTAPRDMMLNAEVRGPAADIYAEYDRNAVAADRVYKGKSTVVIGLVETVTTDVFGRGMVQLFVDERPLAKVTCYVDKSHLDDVAALNGMDWVVMVGEGRGKLLGQVVFNGCRVVTSDRDVKVLNEKVKAIRDGQ